MDFFATHYWQLVAALLVPGILYASWIDYSARRVPNWLNALIAAAGLLVQGLAFGWYAPGVGGVGWGLLGLAVGLGVLIVPWLMHGMGAGDVKLMAAIGCWLGPWLTLVSFATGAILGGGVAVLMIYSSGRAVHALVNLQTILLKMRRFETAFGEFGGARTFGATSQLLPYGVPLTAGTIAVLFTCYLGGWLP
ncbi:MAG: A24 family peptidase [Planctomycetota bacterium]